MFAFLKSLFAASIAAVLSLGALIVVVLVGYIYVLSRDLPDYVQLKDYRLPTVSRFYDSNQSLLGEYAYENRIDVPISAVPRRLINAFLAAEDKNFYNNNTGLNFLGITRAAIKNIINRDIGKLEGGSTITQQVVKNMLLTSEKTFKRKIKEMILAYRITKALSKDRIMELYLNKIYLGNGSYGVGSAALKYFNKSMNELNLAEEALLAALPQAPSRLDPTKNNPHIIERRNWVLQQMVEDGFIDDEEALEAALYPIVLDRGYSKHIIKADFFTEEVRKEIVNKYGVNFLYKGGLFVCTTLVAEHQKIADKFLTKALVEYDIAQGWRGDLGNIQVGPNVNWVGNLRDIADPVAMKSWVLGVILRIHDKTTAEVGLKSSRTIKVQNLQWAKGIKIGDVILVEIDQESGNFIRQIPQLNGAVVILEVSTGRVMAMVGGYDYALSKFNVALQAMRQPGSAVKPFTYIAALENNIYNTSVILDEKLEIFQGPNLPLWVPNNYEKKFFGETTLRSGLELSRNIVALQIAKLVGLDKIHDVAKRFGLYRNISFTNMSSVLGAMEVNLLDITNAYAMIANGGFRTYPSMIEFIQDHDGKTIFRRDKRKCKYCYNISNQSPKFEGEPDRVTDRATAYQMISLLEGSVKRGTSKGLRNLNLVLGGKTGTSNENRDAWFIGFDPDIAIGVYVGFDKPHALGKYYNAARIALPIFRNIISEISKDATKKLFKVPDNVKFIKVNYKTGERVLDGFDLPNVISEVVPMDFEIRAKPLDKSLVDKSFSKQPEDLDKLFERY